MCTGKDETIHLPLMDYLHMRKIEHLQCPRQGSTLPPLSRRHRSAETRAERMPVPAMIVRGRRSGPAAAEIACPSDRFSL